MIWPQDALVLAATKLKTRRIRLIISVIVAGILFVVLTAASLVANGVFGSIESFSEEGFGKRYILQGNPVNPDMYSYNPTKVDAGKLAQVKAAFEAFKKEKAAAAKKLGVTYDPASEPSPIITDTASGQEFYDESSEIAQKLFGDQTVDVASTEQLKSAIDDIKKNYEGIGVYRSVSLGSTYSPSGVKNSQTLRVLKGGKEELPADGQQAFNYAPSSGLSGVENSMSAFSDGMLTDFLLPNQTLESKDGAVPIIVPYKASEEILGMSPLKSGSDTKSKLNRVKEVREKIAGKTFQVCMRNQTSIDRQNTAIQQQNDYTLNKDKKTYTKPELMYDLSDTACQDVVVTRDVRTAETKKYDANFLAFEKQFGKVDAAQRIVTFRVVGVSPDQPEYAGFSVSDIIKSILSSYIGLGWYVPTSAAPLLPEFSSQFEKPELQIEKFSSSAIYIEVANADAARKVVKDKSCEFVYSPSYDPVSAAKDCIAKGQVLNLYPYGSNSLALDQARSGFRRVFPKVLLAVAGISALIMMGTVGKIIADSRRETAVFRAIGAKRFDIAQIYLTYTALIAVLISIVSLSLGWLLALYVQSKYGETMTVEAIVSFNAQDLTKEFGLIGINMREIGLLIAVVFAGSLLSASLPLLTNLRRNPIRDMRDER